MGRSFYPLTPAGAVEDFERNNRLEIPGQRLAYEMTARDGRYFMRQIVLAGDDGREVASHEREMLLVVGSGNHSRSYLTGEQGYLYQMPVCWYPDKPGWDLCPGYEDHNFFFMREADQACLFCHNARVTLVERTTNRYADPLPHGVDCERCHGPGAEHVAFWESRPEEIPDRDATIVNPRRLEPDRRLEVCMQCHLGESVGTVRMERAGRELSAYRPGGDLFEVLDPIAFEEPLENLFGLSSQADRLLRSRCFTGSAGALDCLTCHDPHRSVYEIEEPAAHYRAACVQCHGGDGCTMPENARRRLSAQDDCAGCHMRRSEPADQRFTAFTDHWIRTRPDPPAPPDLNRVHLELAPLFPDRHAELDAFERAFDRGRAFSRMKQAHLSASAIPWSAAEAPLRAAVEEDPASSAARYQLGKVVLERGQAAESLGHFREALRLDPGNFDARKEMGSLLLDLGRPAEAVEALRDAVRLRGDDMKCLTNLGRALVETGQEAEAESIFRQAAELQPSHSMPLANLGLLAARRGRHTEAAAHLEQAVAREPTRAAIWESLAASLEAADRAGEARLAAERGRELRAGRR